MPVMACGNREELIRKAMQIEGWNTVSAYIRDLIREDLKRKGLIGANVNFERVELVGEG